MTLALDEIIAEDLKQFERCSAWRVLRRWGTVVRAEQGLSLERIGTGWPHQYRVDQRYLLAMVFPPALLYLIRVFFIVSRAMPIETVGKYAY
ncbi:hypothetical protein D3C76_953960 [compost metagenome]